MAGRRNLFGRPSLADLYLDAMDAIVKVQPDAIFVLEVRQGVCKGGGACPGNNHAARDGGSRLCLGRTACCGLPNHKRLVTSAGSWLMFGTTAATAAQ